VGSSGSGQGTVEGCCECGDGSSGSGATELVSQLDASRQSPDDILLHVLRTYPK
jgi:hypothetical protein